MIDMVKSINNLFTTAITAMLALSLSVCCCQAHILLGGLAEDHAKTSAAAAPTDFAPSCCTGCKEDPASPAEPGDEEPAPTKGCQTCCIKGTGLKDFSPSLPDAGVLFPAIPVCELASTPPAVHVERSGLNTESIALHVAPQTLLRLRCALII